MSPDRPKFMEPVIVFLVLVILAVPLAFVVWLILHVIHTRNRIDQLSHRMQGLEQELSRLRHAQEKGTKAADPASEKAPLPAVAPPGFPETAREVSERP